MAVVPEFIIKAYVQDCFYQTTKSLGDPYLDTGNICQMHTSGGHRKQG
jgi:hypothetical protein